MTYPTVPLSCDVGLDITDFKKVKCFEGYILWDTCKHYLDLIGYFLKDGLICMFFFWLFGRGGVRNCIFLNYHGIALFYFTLFFLHSLGAISYFSL